MDGPLDGSSDGSGSSQALRPAAFFDLDKTIVAGSSTLALGTPLYRSGLINRRVMCRSAYARILFLLGGADHRRMERMRSELSRLVSGWDVRQLREIVAGSIQHAIRPLVYPEAAALIAEHKSAGRDVLLVSSSGSDVVEPVADLLGIDDVIATRMVVDHGKYTGEIDFYAYADAKAGAMRRLAKERGYDLMASYGYSDSITDCPMLEAVGRPYAVNPDRALRRLAAARGWPILQFGDPRPRSARAEPRGRPRRGPAVAAGVAALVTSGLLWARRSGKERSKRPPEE